MSILEKLFERDQAEIAKELKGTYSIQTLPPTQTKTMRQVGEYEAVVVLHIGGLGRNSHGNGSLGNQVTHASIKDFICGNGSAIGNLVCGKKFRSSSSIVSNQWNTEITCPTCKKRLKKLKLLPPLFVQVVG